MGIIRMMQPCDEHATMTPALLPSTTVLADARGGFGATGAPVGGGVIAGPVKRERVVAPVKCAVSDLRIDRDVPSYPNSIFAGGVRCSLLERPPV